MLAVGQVDWTRARREMGAQLGVVLGLALEA